jgi:hypothetical protein
MSVEVTQMADEVIREVRQVRHEISSRCEHDVHRVVAYYREFQEGLKRSGAYRFIAPVVATKDSKENLASTQPVPMK